MTIPCDRTFFCKSFSVRSNIRMSWCMSEASSSSLDSSLAMRVMDVLEKRSKRRRVLMVLKGGSSRSLDLLRTCSEGLPLDTAML
eukprot:Skav223925  [mRNA]  locus=scaffold2593:360393:363737:- [translate_table: standard]